MDTFEKDYKDIIDRLESLHDIGASEKFRFRAENLLIPSLASRASFLPTFSLRLAVASLVIFLLSGSGLAFAAQRSLPGDVLYPVKLASEKIQLSLTRSNTARIMLHLSNADKRVSEMKATVGKNDETDLNNLSINYSANVDTAIKELQRLENEKGEIQQTVNNHLEQDVRELENVKQTAPTGAVQTIQHAIDTAREGHDETKIQPTAAPVKVTPIQTDVKPAETSSVKGDAEGKSKDVQGISDTNKKSDSENSFSKDSSEKGGD